MPRLFFHLIRRPRSLLLGLCALVMFALWVGLWVRVLAIKPRVVIRPPEPLQFFRFSLDSRTVLAESDWYESQNPVVYVWDSATGRQLRMHSRAEMRVLASLNGSSSTLIERSKNPRLWAAIDAPPRTLGRRLSPDGRKLAVSHQTTAQPTTIWDIPTDQPVGEIKHEFRVDISADGSAVAGWRYGQGGRREVVLVNAETGQELGVLPNCEWWGLPVFSPDGSLVAVGYTYIADDADSTTWDRIKVWSAKTHSEVAVIDDGGKDFTFSSDGRYLGIVRDPFHDSFVRLWKTGSWEIASEFGPFPKHTGDLVARFVPNTNLMMISCERLPIRDALSQWLENLTSRRKADTVERVRLVTFIDVESGCEYGPISGHYGDPIVSPDGQTLAVLDEDGSSEIHLYDLPPRRPVELYMLFSVLPTLLFTGLLWWRLR